jgi:hypothetical protein
MRSLFLALALLCTQLVFAQTTKIDRPGFTLEYPSSWTVDTKDPDYDPDALFSLDIDENNLMMFVIMDTKVDPKMLIDAQQSQLKERLMKKTESETPFTRWGAYTGNGLTMKGKLLGVFPGTIRIFSANHGELTLLVVSQCLDSDLKKWETAMKNVEQSFHFKETTK